jgi:hypothetical protein
VELPAIEPISFEGQRLDLDYYLKHDYESIDLANQELPAIAEWINSQLQWFVEEKYRLKQEIKRVEAEVYVDLVSGKFQTLYPELKKTEAAISHAVALDQRVTKIHNTHARVVGWTSRLQNTLLGIQTKIDLVRSNEATNRKVFQDEPRDRDEPGDRDADERNDSRASDA